jgi:hypothetical protein
MCGAVISKTPILKQTTTPDENIFFNRLQSVFAGG